MPAYEYRALDASGREVKGVLEGDTPRQIRSQLRERKLSPLSVTEASGRASKSSTADGKLPKTSNRGISAGDLALITRQVATLAASGTPLEESLGAVSRQTEKQRVKSLLLSVRSKVLEGHTLASALGDFPKAFPEIYRATVAAGEQSGHLDAVLERLADYTENRQALEQTITKALIYPSLMVVMSILIVTMLLTYVVPQIVSVFEGMNADLPPLTVGLIAASDFMREWWWAVFGGAGLLVFASRRAMRIESIRYSVHRQMLRIPVVGRLVRNANTTSFARTLSILAASGVPVLEALEIASQVLHNRPMRAAVKETAVSVREGASMSRSLEKSGLFPPMMLHLIASGESSGRLGPMLEKAATHQERELNSIISIALGLFEPFIILFMGGVVLVIVLAILLPIFQLNQIVG
jgi:general secretion pathway protein F